MSPCQKPRKLPTNVNTVYNDLMNINVIRQSTRPLIRCKFQRSEARALYDTGSCVTCMSEVVYKDLQPSEKTLSQTGRSFRSASGDQMKTKGVIDLTMQVEGKTVSQKIHVIPRLHEPFILGIDFIRDHGLSYCPRHHHFYWEKQCPLDHGAILVLKERMVIPPLCSRICMVKVDGAKMSDGVGVATIRIPEMPWIRGGPVLTNVEGSCQALIEIRNASPVPRELLRGSSVGTFEKIDEEELIPVEMIQDESNLERGSQDELSLGRVSQDECKKPRLERGSQDECTKSTLGRVSQDVCAMSTLRGGLSDERDRGLSKRWKNGSSGRTQGTPRDHRMVGAKKFIDENVHLKCDAKEANSYKELFYQHADVFSKHKNDLGRCDLVQHEIHLKDKNPVYIKQFKIPEVHATSIEEQVKEWLKLDIVQPSMSRFNSPIFVVKKKDGAFRLVQDFRALNSQTYPDRYSMRDVTDCIHEIGKSGSTIFSTIDLTSGFWQMVLKPECRPYTAFTVYGMGQFEFKTSPMGLLGCPASFQRLMEAVMKGIPNVLVYIDDILVHSKTHEEHRKTLDLVFRRLERHNLKIRLEKCHFATREVEYLGFRLTPEGVLPGTDKTAVIKSAAPPDNVQRVRQFLGLCNFFRNHIRDFATRSHPLTVLTRKDCPWKGGPLPDDALKAFNELKSALTSSPIIAFPRKDRQYALITDAATGDSNNPGGMGAILTQIDQDGKFYVIAYASRKLVKHELNYTPFLLEMHAAVWGMEHFSHHLKGKRFLLFTDHKPLEKLGKVHTKTLYRIQEAMMEYDFEIFYKKGEEMPADFLSRNICSLSPELSLENVGRLQKQDIQLSVIINYLRNGTLPKSNADRQLIAKYGSRCFLDNDVLWIRFYRPEIGSRSVICLPTSLRKAAIEHMHSSWYGGHAGTLKTVERLLLYYYWPNINNEVQQHLSQCERCQKRQTTPKIPNAHLQPLPLLSEPNQRIHADLFGPLKTSDKGKKFILVMTDAFTRYVELVAIENKETETVANAIFVHWICRYGVPLEIVTDQGKEFVSHICQTLWDKLELIHNTTTPRHPQANSQAEVVNRSIIRYLASFVDDTTLDWECFLAPLMFSYNTTFHRSLKTSPFFMTFGVHPRVPQEIVRPQYGSDLPTEIMQRLQVARNVARSFMNKAALDYKEQHDRHAKQREFVVNQEVLLDEHSFLNKNQKLCPKFSGPHIITRLKGPVDVELLLNTGRRVIVHVNRIKPFKAGAPPLAGVPSQNRGGVEINSEDEAERPMGAQGESGPITGRMTRSKAKKLGLVFDSDTLKFSQPNSLQAIGSRGKRKGRKRLTKAKQVMSHYIQRDIDSDDEWEVTPNWGDPKIEASGSEDDDEFLEAESSAEEDKPEPKFEPLPIVQPHVSPPKTVKFNPVVQEVKYDPDAELQKLWTTTKKADEYLRVAKAAVDKVKEELQDVQDERRTSGNSDFVGHGRGSSAPTVQPGKPGAERPSDGGTGSRADGKPKSAERTLTPSKHRSGGKKSRSPKRSGGVPPIPGVPRHEGPSNQVPIHVAGGHPASGTNPVFGASTFGTAASGIPGVPSNVYAAATGIGSRTAAATSTAQTTEPHAGVPVQKTPPTTGGWTFGNFGTGNLPTFGDLSRSPQGGLRPGAGEVPTTVQTPETGSTTPDGGGAGTPRPGRTPDRGDPEVHKRKGHTRSRSEGPNTRGRKDLRDRFGLYPWYPAEEGKNDPFYVKVLAEKWVEDRAQLRQRVIDGDPPGSDTLTEHRRRFEFLSREAQRTGCPLPKHFALD